MKDIAETRDNLIKNINELTNSYSLMLTEKTNRDIKDNSDILFLNNQNKLQLQEINNFETEVSKLNKNVMIMNKLLIIIK